jgi:hypothetical protein
VESVISNPGTLIQKASVSAWRSFRIRHTTVMYSIPVILPMRATERAQKRGRSARRREATGDRHEHQARASTVDHTIPAGRKSSQRVSPIRYAYHRMNVHRVRTA